MGGRNRNQGGFVGQGAGCIVGQKAECIVGQRAGCIVGQGADTSNHYLNAGSLMKNSNREYTPGVYSQITNIPYLKYSTWPSYILEKPY